MGRLAHPSILSIMEVSKSSKSVKLWSFKAVTKHWINAPRRGTSPGPWPSACFSKAAGVFWVDFPIKYLYRASQHHPRGWPKTRDREPLGRSKALRTWELLVISGCQFPYGRNGFWWVLTHAHISQNMAKLKPSAAKVAEYPALFRSFAPVLVNLLESISGQRFQSQHLRRWEWEKTKHLCCQTSGPYSIIHVNVIFSHHILFLCFFTHKLGVSWAIEQLKPQLKDSVMHRGHFRAKNRSDLTENRWILVAELRWYIWQDDCVRFNMI